MATTVNSIGSTKPIQVGFGGTGLASTTVNQILYCPSTNTIGGLATANNSVLATSAGGSPSLTSTLPNAVQSNITQLGTVTSGTWNGSVITPPYGGTGVNNGSNTITLNSNVTFQGSFPYIFAPTTGIVTITFPTSGVVETLPTITSNHQILSSKTGTAGWESRYIDDGLNLSVGTLAGNASISGINNTSIGVGAAAILSNGSQNTSCGSGSLGSENIGINNTAIGYQALVNQLNGNHNTALGYRAGLTVAGGGIGHCTLIGAKADVSSGSLVNATAIGYNAIVGQSNSIVLGNGANVGIGTSTPNTSSILDLTSTTSSLLVPRMTDVQRNLITAAGGMVIYDTTSSTLQFYNGSSWVSAGSGGGGGGVPPITDDYQVLTSGTGTATWFGQYYDPNDATQSVYLGTGSGGSFGGNFNTAMGYDSLKNNVEDGLTAFGYRSLSQNTGGQGNSGFGLETLGINSTGNSNSAFGYHSMLYNLTGSNNASFGFEALKNLGITGFFTSDHNSAFGASSLKFQNQGQFCSAFGSQALMNAGGSSSSNNSAFGYNSGTTITNGSQCTFLGSGADSSSATLTNATAIGYNAIVSTSNSLVLGNGARVGIGTSSPNASSILDLTSTTGSLLVPRMTDTQRNALTATAGMVIYDTTSTALQFYNGSSWVSAGGSGGLPSITTNHQLLTTGTGTAIWESQFIDSGGITHNISLGTGAGNATISGGFNTSMGFNAGHALTSGNVNTCFGAGSLTLATSGANNSAFGANALSAVVSNSDNSAFGRQAGLNLTGSANSIFGAQALDNETFGSSNAAFGYGALGTQQGVSGNSAFGYHAGASITNGGRFCAFGFNALAAEQGGTNNSAFGYESLLVQNGGDNNSAFGYYSGHSMTSGLNNSMFGVGALSLATTDRYNAAFGCNALLNQSGTGVDNNTGLGYSAGSVLTGGSQCTFIGSGANAGVTALTNSTAIGYNAIVSTNNSMVLGSGVRVGIGTSSPDASAILDLTSTTGALLLPRMDDTQRDALTAAAGMLIYDITSSTLQYYNGSTWTGGGGGGGGLPVITADHQLLTSGTGSTVWESQYIDDGTNLSIGTGAGNASISGTGNISIGTLAGGNLSSGGQNTSVGSGALAAESTAGDNCAFGYEALFAQNGAYSNVGIGYQAGTNLTSGNGNVIVGFRALQAENAGTQNVILGYSACFNQDGGSNNVVIGASSAADNVTGSGLTLLGASVSVDSSAIINGTAIGYNSFLALDNTMILGNGARIGVGTSYPETSAILDLFSTTGALLVPRMTSTQRDSLTPVAGMVLYDSSSSALEYYNGSSWVMAGGGGGGGVTDINGTSNQIDVSATTGSVILSIPSTFIAPGSIEATTTVTAGSYLQLPTSSSTGGAIKINGVEVFHTFNGNTFISDLAGNFTLSGSANVCVGSNCGKSLTSGANNVAIGNVTLFNATDGYNNTCLGTAAAFNLTLGTYNVTIGLSAGSVITDGSSCTIIGASANVGSGSLNNATAIGYNTIVNQSNSLVLGNGVNVGIGTSTPNTSAILDLTSTTGALLLPRMDDVQRNALTATAGMVVFDITSNNLQFYNGSSWVGGYGSVSDINGTTNQINTSGATGSVTLSIPSTFIAPGSIEATTTVTAGTYLELPTTSNAGGTIKIGGTDVFHTYGTNNIFVGNGSGNFTMFGSSNAFIGYNSGSALTSGVNNVGHGTNTLLSCQSGYNNTCIGVDAGISIVSGYQNTLIGVAAGSSYSSSESNNIIIGNLVPGNSGETNVLRIMNGSGPGGISAAYISGINDVSLSGSAVPVFIEPGTDQLGTVVSSRRYKDNIEDMGSFSDPIYKLRPTTFTMKGDDRVIPGLIAEEVYEIMPELVILDKEGLPQTVKYHELPSLLLNEMHKLKKEISDLKLLINAQAAA